MEEQLVRGLNGGGFAGIFDFEGWRIARNGYKKGVNDIASITTMGRHRQTKEVFVLLEGEAFLLTSQGDAVGEIACQKLRRNHIYIVPQNIWHFLVIKEGGLAMIVENSGTSPENSDMFRMSEEQIDRAVSAVESED